MDDLPSSPYDRVVSRWRLGGAPPAAADDDVPVRCLDDGHLGPGADAVRDLLGRAMWLHVAIGAGPAVHAVVYTAVAPRTRRGVVLDEDGRPLSLGDAACQARLTAFQSIEAGDRVVRVCGYGLRAGAGLCHCLCLRFASGRAFCVAGADLAGRGPAFDYACPPGCAVIALRFGGGTCRGLDVAATTLYASYNIREHRLLKSRTAQAAIFDAFSYLVSTRLVPTLVLCHVFSYLRGFDFLQPFLWRTYGLPEAPRRRPPRPRDALEFSIRVPRRTTPTASSSAGAAGSGHTPSPSATARPRPRPPRRSRRRRPSPRTSRRRSRTRASAPWPRRRTRFSPRR